MFEQGQVTNVQAHEAEFVARVQRVDSERAAEMNHALTRYRDEAEAQRRQAESYAQELRLAQEERQRMVDRAELVFRNQEAALATSRSELTAGTESTAVQRQRVLELEVELQRARDDYERSRAALSGETEAEVTIRELIAEAKHRETELSHMA